jgi:hypothetical protein
MVAYGPAISARHPAGPPVHQDPDLIWLSRSECVQDASLPTRGRAHFLAPRSSSAPWSRPRSPPATPLMPVPAPPGLPRHQDVGGVRRGRLLNPAGHRRLRGQPGMGAGRGEPLPDRAGWADEDHILFASDDVEGGQVGDRCISSCAALTGTGSEIVWRRAQTRSWSATPPPSHQTRTRSRSARTRTRRPIAVGSTE